MLHKLCILNTVYLKFRFGRKGNRGGSRYFGVIEKN